MALFVIQAMYCFYGNRGLKTPEGNSIKTNTIIVFIVTSLGVDVTKTGVTRVTGIMTSSNCQIKITQNCIKLH